MKTARHPMAVLACIVLIELLLGTGCRNEIDSTDVFRVTGPSMAPTLAGESQRVRCSNCALDWWVDASSPERAICWHCGNSVIRSGETIPGTLVKINRGQRSPKAGEMVAFMQGGQPTIKRVIGLPGDEIDVSGLRLLVNGESIRADSLDQDHGTLPVDADGHRDVSRWQSDANTFGRDDARRWVLRESSPDDWLVYHHLSVHDQNLPSQIWDDYPVNFGLTRKLEPVDRLFVSGQVVEASPEATLRIALWSTNGNKSATFSLRSGNSFRIEATETRDDTEPLLAPEKPIAVRMERGTATIEQLSIHRPIQYRLRPRDDNRVYPIKLLADEYYVLGDNVPVSVDSRDHGPITQKQMMGTVTKRLATNPDGTKRSNASTHLFDQVIAVGEHP